MRDRDMGGIGGPKHRTRCVTTVPGACFETRRAALDGENAAGVSEGFAEPERGWQVTGTIRTIRAVPANATE